jgi:hypothetical protein
MITKQQLQKLRVDLDAALAGIANAHNLKSLTMGRCTFDPNAGSFQFKVEGVAAGGSSKDAQYYEMLRMNAPQLPALDSPEATRMFGDKRGTIVGANSTLSKILIRHEEDGRVFLYKTPMVRQLFGARS